MICGTFIKKHGITKVVWWSGCFRSTLDPDSAPNILCNITDGLVVSQTKIVPPEKFNDQKWSGGLVAFERHK